MEATSAATNAYVGVGVVGKVDEFQISLFVLAYLSVRPPNVGITLDFELDLGSVRG